MRLLSVMLVVMAAAMATASTPLPAAAQGPRSGRPNILYIMTDDHAAHAISAYGSRVNQTPNIDRLAREGALLTSVFATNSICTPSRAAILTGQYSHLNGVPVFNRFDSSRTTVARLLQQGGYYTGMIGKWHLGSDPAGFDRWEILPGQGVYFDPVFYTATSEKTYTGRTSPTSSPTWRSTSSDKRPRDKPFFLMCTTRRRIGRGSRTRSTRPQFAGRRIPEPSTFWDDYADPHRRPPREPAARRRGPDPPRPQADAARRTWPARR